MNNFKIHYSLSRFGKIYVVCGENCFPSGDWTDFSCDVIFDWYQTIIENEFISDSSFKLCFFDGSFHLLCHKKYDEIIIQAIDERNDTVEFEVIIPYVQLKDILLKAKKDMDTAIVTNPEKFEYPYREE